MPRRLSLSMALLAGLAGIGQVAAQELPPTPAGSLASQRQWLLQQVRIGEATGRQRLIEDALARLRLLAPDDRATMVAILEVQLSQQKIDDATGTLQRLRQIGAGSRELIAGERLWAAYRGDMQAELQQARMLATGGRNAEALAIYRRLFDDDPPGMQLGLEYWRLRGAEPAGRALAIRRLTALDEAYPGNTVLLQTLAQFLFASGRDGEALAILGRMGSNPEASTYAADAEWDYLSSRQADATNVRRLQSFIARYPGWVHLDDARRLYDEQRRRVGNPAWLAGLRGGQLLDAGRNAEAETAFRQALRGFPQEADFQGGLGLALMRQGRREQALEQFQTAQRLQADTSNSDKWRDLIASTRYWLLIDQADAALEAGELDRAQSLYAQARRQQPREINAQLGLVDVAVARGDDAAAGRELQAARRIAPNDPNLVRRLAQFYGRTDPAQLESYVAGLPPAQRGLYAEELRRLRLAKLREQRERALAAGDVATAIELGRELRREQPDDPWLAYSQANALRTRGAAEEGDAVIAEMAGKAGNTPEARYAQALYLSGSDRIAPALAALDELPSAQWSDDMRALAARLHRQQATARAWELRAAGREDEAIALLRQLPQDADIQLTLADWARLRGDHAQALQLYGQVLDAQPGNVDAQLGSVQTLIDSGDLQAARARMAAAPPAVEPADVGQQRQLAAIWSGLHDDARALEILRGVLAAKTAPDPQVWRDAARLLRADDPEQALDMYARAMEENGLLAPQQAQPRDDRALTRASRETAGDDWLRRSLRGDVETLYQQQNPTLTVMQDSGRRSDGTPGISKLSRDTRIAHLDAPFAGGLGWARIEQVHLDARRFETDANGFHDQDFGSCELYLQRGDGSRLQAPGCDTRLRQRMDSGAGLAVGWRTLDDRWNFDIGHTPAGYAVGNWLGGVTVNGDLGRFGWGATLSRRPMTNSLLSQAGAVDPRSGIVWGGVTANGVTFSLGYDQGGRNGVWSNWSWHRLTGRNVMDNDRARAMAGWYHKLVQRPDLRVDVGLTGMYWRYARDLGGYSLGQGGYYSPQRYASLSVPVSLAWRNDDWSVRVDASLGVSRAHTASISRFPEPSLIERVIEQLQPLYGPLTLDPAGLYTADSSSTGTGHRLYMAVERRLGDHFVLGAAGTLQRSQDYSPNTFQLYLRYTLKPWQGNLPLPVSPLVPYGEFR
ncbi:MAG: cellulose biosynthesis protein BcsC [Stenotrophomonas nitritireducens]|uniref:cellulose synthase complex outer membrane protein BcsC n=1 Tax=Stenotrophomonas nitritireducens TaxID=83617 RepID=UPI001AC9AAEE|nr:cellulose synthase complex outer membrane protein BcsC [Stenotrophomonas nitritireducens]MBN8791378.1 cellulose biosynthesis protein BcsC [Stenotrophomonas nitritireducens]MBN8795319.1 cellulose biosynthesis protein BcsC [Stenotrophomonas nitritireducens]